MKQQDTVNLLIKAIQILTGVAAFFMVAKLNSIEDRFLTLETRQHELESRVSAIELYQAKDEERHNEKIRILQSILDNQTKQQVELKKLETQIIDLIIMNPSLKTQKRGG